MTELITADIVLATTIKISGYPLIRIECEGRRGFFIFSGVDEEFISRFNCGQLMVEPLLFHSTLKQLTASVVRQQGVDVRGARR